MAIISSLIILTYLLYIICKYGVPHSISLSYYLIKHKWIFSLILISSVALILPGMLEMEYSYLAFPALCGVLFVAATPNFKDNELIDNVHTYSAIIALIFSLLWVGLMNYLILSLWALFFVYLLSNRSIQESNYKFYAEIIMLLTVYILLAL